MTDLNFKKIGANARKVGFREGVSHGRENNLQSSFDRGFAEGFKIGYALGQYKGALSAEGLPNDELLTEPEKGLCQMCAKTQLTIDEAIRDQIRLTMHRLTALHSRYGNKNLSLKSSIN